MSMKAGPLETQLLTPDDAPDPEEFPRPQLTQAGHLIVASLGQAPMAPMAMVPCHPCNECEKVFTCDEGLGNHIETMHVGGTNKTNHHSGEEIGSLTKSGKLIHLSPNFGSKHIEFLRTMNLDHNDQEYDTSSDENEEADYEAQVVTFECDKCSFVVNWADTLMTHKREHHYLRNGPQAEFVITCNKCNYVTNLEDKLTTHKIKVHNPHKFTCEMCQYTSGSKAELEQHAKDEHENFTPCTVCGESSRDVASLQIHILTKHCTQSDEIIQLIKNQEVTITLMQQQIQHILQRVNTKVPVPKEVVHQTQDPTGRLEAHESHEAPSYAAVAQASTVA